MTNQSNQQISMFDAQPVTVNLEALYSRGFTAPCLALDIETNTAWQGVGPEAEYGLSYPAEITVIAFAWPEGKDIHTAVYASPDGKYPLEFCERLRARFQEPRHVVAHNAVFDFRQLSKLTGGVTPESVHCTMVMERLINPMADRKYDLLSTASGYGIQFPDWMKAMKGKRNALHDQPLEKVAEYGAADARLALEVYRQQWAGIEYAGEKLADLALWEMRAMREYCQMAARGVAINTEYVRARLTELYRECEEARARLASDGLLDPDKRMPILKYIHETKRIPLPRYAPLSPRFTNAAHERIKALQVEDKDDLTITLEDLSLSAKALQDIIGSFSAGDQEDSDWLEHTGTDAAKKLEDLITYKQSNYLINVLSALLDHAALDGRIHSLVTINTTAGRRSANHPQVQNLKFPAMAGVFVGGEGHTLVEIDYSNAENWAAAMLAGDSALAEACAAADFHSHMASVYFRDRWNIADKDTRKKLRRMGKSITFGTAYGMGAKKLALTLGITEGEAVELLRAKDMTFSAVAETKRKATEKAEREGFINLWTGRKIPVSKQTSYTAWNYLCQGAVAEMVKRSIVLISEAYQEKGLRSYIALDMHDAIIVSVAHDEWETAIQIACKAMQGIIPDRYNQRTTPPIQWIAKPDFDDNARKWGKGQIHPVNTADTQHTDIPAKTFSLPEIQAETPKQVSRYQEVKIRHDLLDFEGVLIVDLEATEDSATKVTEASLSTYYRAMLDRITEALQAGYETRLPTVTDDGQVIAGNVIQVDFVNYAKAPHHWLSVSDKCDLESVIGVSREGLEAVARERYELLSYLQERWNTAHKWLTTVDKSHAVSH